MPTIVHTMLVRVGSMVCCGRVAAASAGVVTSGWGAIELSAKAALALRLRAAPRSWWSFSPVRDDRYRLNQPPLPIRLHALTQGARTLAGRHSVGSGRWQDTYGFGHVVPLCVATRPARIAARGGAAAPLPPRGP
jgi:hypothetical protein